MFNSVKLKYSGTLAFQSLETWIRAKLNDLTFNFDSIFNLEREVKSEFDFRILIE